MEIKPMSSLIFMLIFMMKMVLIQQEQVLDMIC